MLYTYKYQKRKSKHVFLESVNTIVFTAEATVMRGLHNSGEN